MSHRPLSNTSSLKIAAAYVQGGSDISGTLSMLHCRIKKQ